MCEYDEKWLQIGNHLIPKSKIHEISFLPDGFVYVVGDMTYFNEDIARAHADPTMSFAAVRSPILVVHYVNFKNEPDFVRKHGEEAVHLWEKFTKELI